MPATKRGIYHNLKESEYTISNGEIVFFFSSKTYLRKFMMGYHEHRDKFISKISQIVQDSPLNMNLVADISFYESVEKRGFRAMIKGINFDSIELYQYALRFMLEKHIPEWSEIPAPKLSERMRYLK